MTEDFAFLAPIQQVFPGVRAGWVGRVPKLPTKGDRDAAMRQLRPVHEAAIASFAGSGTPCWRAEQVHGNRIAVVPGPAVREAPDGLPIIPDVDGLITNTPGIVVAIYVADCGAIWLADRRTGAIGLLHSGKKGTESGILGQALERMASEFGTCPEDVTCVLSPCIRPPHYEVDFAARIAGQAATAGISGFHDCGEDTAGDLSRFYSYRLENGQTGRMMALITKDPLP